MSEADQHVLSVYVYLQRRVGGVRVAEQLTEEVFRRARREGFDESTITRAELLRIARDVLGEHRRGDGWRRRLRRRWRRLRARWPEDVGDESWDDLPRPPMSRSSSALAQLPEVEREILMMYTLKEASVPEIAAVLRVPAEHVQEVLDRAQRSFGRAFLWEPESGEEGAL